jgi:membrane protein
MELEHDEPSRSTDDDRGPSRPSELSMRSWWGVVKRSVREARADHLTDWAAALTFYSVLALFPALIVLVAIVGLVGQYPETTNALLDIVGRLGPKSAVHTFREPITGVVRGKGGAAALLGFGLLGALWSASAYVGAFMRASNAIYAVDEGRRFWKLRPLQIAITLGMVLTTALVAVAIVLTGPVAQAVGDQIGSGGTVVAAWNVGKWPILFLVVTTMFAVLYYTAPNLRLPYFRWITPGSVLAVVIALIASAGFGIYVAYFGSYNQTYGTLGGIIVFLVWLWIVNLALLVGAEFNAELERGREIESGEAGAQRELQLPPRARKRRRSAA